jgi:hypothetical protein
MPDAKYQLIADRLCGGVFVGVGDLVLRGLPPAIGGAAGSAVIRTRRPVPSAGPWYRQRLRGLAGNAVAGGQ